jgi:MFS transporter, YQGE family, putative transporter
MKNPFHEYRVFLSYPRNMRVLLVTNLIYAFVMPVIEIFIGAYVMRNSNDVKMVIAYQLAVYSGVPFTFLINGWLLKGVNIKRLYSMGMLLSGVSMVWMMSLNTLNLFGLAVAGLLMGMSFGLYWSNRDFLALSSTDDANRNYYYGLENFFATNTGIIVPVSIGAFIGSFGSAANHAYQIITGVVFVLTILASIVVHQGGFENPPRTRFIYFRYHRLWNRMQLLAVLKGLGQGYIVTAPAMLVMTLVGKEGSLGTLQTVGAVFSAVLLYILGRTTRPRHRIYIFAAGLFLFVSGAVPNALFYDRIGVLVFMLCLVLGRPLQDVAYFTIQMLVIDTVSAIESRNKYAYIFNQEFGFYVGRFAGCGLFLFLAFHVSNTFALRYALLIIGLVQLLSVFVARQLLAGCAAEKQASSGGSQEKKTSTNTASLCEQEKLATDAV